MSDEREHEEKETYRKVDQRPGREVEAEAEAPEELPAEEPEEYDHEAAEAAAAAAMQFDTYGLLRMVLGMFADQAWVQMGLQLAPGAKELTTDLKQARVAIDTVNFIKDALGDNLSAAEKREVEQLVATLRMNFVQRA